MVWIAISWNYFGRIVDLHGRMNSKDYRTILRNHAQPIVHVLFSDGDGIFQNDNAPIHTAHVVKNQYKEPAN